MGHHFEIHVIDIRYSSPFRGGFLSPPAPRVEAQWNEKDRKRLREATTIISQANLAKTLSISRAAITQAKKMIQYQG